MEIPENIGNYHIEYLLGSGGMADVYLATHVLLNKLFAIKIMKPQLSANDSMMEKRFVREAQLAQKVNHPNIVKVFDVGCDENTGLLYIVMEYVEGQNLSEYSRENVIPSRHIREIAYEMTKALIALQEMGIVHRDIKPSNIMLCTDGSIKLMDLGIAKALHSGQEGEATLTMEQAVLGTPAYSSPEQCIDAKTVDIRSDIYCLGASLYAIASGRVPYGGTTAMEILIKVIEDKPQPLATIRRDLDSNLISLIEWMMEKSPDKRPQTPQDLLVALVSGKVRQRRRWGWVAAFVAVAVLACALGICLWQTHHSSEYVNSSRPHSKHVTLDERLADVQRKMKREAVTSQYADHEANTKINELASDNDFVLNHFDEFTALVHQVQCFRIKEQISRRKYSIAQKKLNKKQFDADTANRLQEEFAAYTDKKSGKSAIYIDKKSGKPAAIDHEFHSKMRFHLSAGMNQLENYLIPSLKDIKPAEEPELVNFVKDLILLNHDVHETDTQDNTALHYAARNGLFDVSALLVASGADVNAKNNKGETPLFEAAKAFQSAIEKLLLDHGADDTVQNKEGKTVEVWHEIGRFKAAVLAWDVPKMQMYLNKGFSPDTIVEKTKQTLLERAIANGDLDMMKLLLKLKANPELHSASRFTPLALTMDCRQSSKDSTAAFTLLLEHGANPNTEPAYSFETTEDLLDFGNNSKYLLDFLVRNYNFKSQYSSSKNNPPLDNDRILTYASMLFANEKAGFASQGNYAKIFESEKRKLLAVFLQNTKEFKDDNPALPFALAGDVSDDIVLQLIEKNANVNSSFFGSKFDFPKEYSQQYPFTRTKDSRTALYIAVERRRLSTVKLLLKHGADKNWVSQGGMSIQQLKTSDVIKELLNHGSISDYDNKETKNARTKTAGDTNGEPEKKENSQSESVSKLHALIDEFKGSKKKENTQSDSASKLHALMDEFKEHQKNVTLEERLEDVQRKIASESKSSKTKDNEISANIINYAKQNDFVTKHFKEFKAFVHLAQRYRIKEQIKRRDYAINLKTSKFDAEATRKVQESIAVYTKEHRDWGYNNRDIVFSNNLLNQLKTGRINPNVEVVDSTYPRYSGPLLFTLLSGRFQKDEELVSELLRLGANANLVMERQPSVLNKKVFNILTTGGVDRLENYLIPLLKSMKSYDKATITVIQDLILLNHDVNEKVQGNTALHYAVQHSLPEVIALLVASGANINARNMNGETPLFEAVKSSQAGNIKLLLALGADATAQNNDGKTATAFKDLGLFKKAVMEGNVKTVQKYLDKGFSPDTILESSKQTLLECACFKKNLEMIELLLKYKADTELHRASNNTPLAMAMAIKSPTCDEKVFSLLLKYGANPNTAPYGWGGIYLMDYLMCQYNYNIRGEENLKKARYFMKELFDCGRAKVAAKNSYSELFDPERKDVLSIVLQNTPEFQDDIPVLVFALAKNASDEMINTLIEKKANVNSVFSENKYYLGRNYLEKFPIEGFSDTRTALYIAVECRRLSMVKLLLKHGAEKGFVSKSGTSIRQLNTSNEIKALLR